MALYPDYNIEAGGVYNGQQDLLNSLIEEEDPSLVPFDFSQSRQQAASVHPLGLLMQVLPQALTAIGGAGAGAYGLDKLLESDASGENLLNALPMDPSMKLILSGLMNFYEPKVGKGFTEKGRPEDWSITYPVFGEGDIPGELDEEGFRVPDLEGLWGTGEDRFRPWTGETKDEYWDRVKKDIIDIPETEKEYEKLGPEHPLKKRAEEVKKLKETEERTFERLKKTGYKPSGDDDEEESFRKLMKRKMKESKEWGKEAFSKKGLKKALKGGLKGATYPLRKPLKSLGYGVPTAAGLYGAYKYGESGEDPWWGERKSEEDFYTELVGSLGMDINSSLLDVGEELAIKQFLSDDTLKFKGKSYDDIMEEIGEVMKNKNKPGYQRGGYVEQPGGEGFYPSPPGGGWGEPTPEYYDPNAPTWEPGTLPEPPGGGWGEPTPKYYDPNAGPPWGGGGEVPVVDPVYTGLQPYSAIKGFQEGGYLPRQERSDLFDPYSPWGGEGLPHTEEQLGSPPIGGVLPPTPPSFGLGVGGRKAGFQEGGYVPMQGLLAAEIPAENSLQSQMFQINNETLEEELPEDILEMLLTLISVGELG